MTSIPSLAAALVGVALAQAGGTPPVGPDGSDETVERPSTSPADDITGPPGIPFLPSTGTRGVTRGTLLDVALLTGVRTQTINVSASEARWGTDLEVTPGIGLEVGSPPFTLSLGYAPRLTIPVDSYGPDLAILNRATLLAAWRADPRWEVTAAGLFVVGDYSQLMPASTPGGAGPPPPVVNPIRSFLTYPYVGIDTWLRVEGDLSQRSRIRLAGGYFDVGGLGSVGQAAQPRTWGPQAEAIFSWDASRTTSLVSTASAQNWVMVENWNVGIATLTEGWRETWTRELDTTLSAGATLSNRDIESTTALGHLAPVASFRLDYHQQSRQPLHATFDASLAPYVDTYLRIPYQRVSLGGAVDWSPSEAWRVAASLTYVIAPRTLQVPESFGALGASANFSPLPFLVLTAGAFSWAQFQGTAGTSGTFRQWTLYLSCALRDRLSL